MSWESLEKIAKGGVVRGLNGARRLPLRKGWWSVRPPHAGCPQLSACCYLDRGGFFGIWQLRCRIWMLY